MSMSCSISSVWPRSTLCPVPSTPVSPWADRHGKLETRAATHQLVHQVDALQYEFRQGPCVDAVGGQWQARSDDLSIDSRWPVYGPRAADLGIVSQMGIELFDEPGCIAGLNLYSSTAGAFDDDTVEAAMLFAIQ